MPKHLLSLLYKYDGRSRTKLSSLQKKTKDKLVSDFKKGIIRWERNKCRCYSKNDLTIATKDRLGFYVRIVLCKNCGLIRTDPRISEEFSKIFYEKYYRNLITYSLDNLNESDRLSHVFKREMIIGNGIFNFIKKNISLKKGIVFDLGAGTGGMLNIFKKEGFEIFGVDLNETFLDYGKKKDLNLKVGSIDELKKYPKKANLIIVSHILEHLHNLDEYLKKLWECLDNDGYLYVELPGVFNQDNFLDFFVIEHLYYFTLSTLEKILVRNGFKLLVGSEEIKALFQKTTQKLEKKISKNFIEELLIYLRVYDIPLPLNPFELIKNKTKLKAKFLLSVISVLYKSRLINFLAILRKFFIYCGIILSFQKFSSK